MGYLLVGKAPIFNYPLARHVSRRSFIANQDHQCLGLYLMTAGRVAPWIFERDGDRREWLPNSRITVSSTEALIPALIAGTGIGYLVEGILGRPLAAKQLVPILTDWVRKDRLPVSVVYPHNRHLSAKTRAFVEFVAGLFPRERAVRRPVGGSGD